MSYFAKSFLILAICTGFTFVASAKQHNSDPGEYLPRFMSDLGKYRECMMTFANKEVSDTSKSPESIAKSAHGACEAEFSAALRSSIEVNTSLDPQRSRQQTFNAAKNVMSVHRTEARNNVIKAVNAKRSETDS